MVVLQTRGENVEIRMPTCRVNPQFLGTMPVPNPHELLLMKEHALPAPSTTVR